MFAQKSSPVVQPSDCLLTCLAASPCLLLFEVKLCDIPQTMSLLLVIPDAD